MLTRRDVLQQVGMAAAVAVTAPWWLVRRAHAARREKLIVWNQIAQAPQVDRLMRNSVTPTPSKPGSRKMSSNTSNPAAASRRRSWSPRWRRGSRRMSPGPGAPGVALSLPGTPAGGDRRRREDAESAGRSLSESPSMPSCMRAKPTASHTGEPLALDHADGYSRGRQGRSPQNLGRVHCGLHEAAETSQAHGLRYVPGPAERCR